MTSVQGIIRLLGAIAATLLLLWTAQTLAPAGVIINLLVPLPAAFVHMREGSAGGAVIVALCSSALYLIGDAGSVLAYMVQFGLLSLALPFFLRKGWAWDRAAGACLAILVAVALAALAGLAAYRQAPLEGLVAEYVGSEVDAALAIYEAAEIPPEQLAEVREVVEGMGAFMLDAWPALMVVGTGVLLLVTLFLLGVLGRGRYELPGPSFRRWKSPEVLIWALIAAGFAFFFGEGAVKVVGVNLLTVLLPLYFLHGLAIVAHYFEKKSFAPFARALGYLLLTLLSPLPLVVTSLGVFDLWVDFRKPRIKKAT